MTGRRLPLHVEVTCYSGPSIAGQGFVAAQKFEAMARKLAVHTQHAIDGGAFWWKYALVPGALYSSAWVLVAYEALPFIAWTLDPNECPDPKRLS